jgi:MFS family permease
MSRLLRNFDPRAFFTGGVARSQSFRTFWFGQGMSQIGSAVSLAALPLIAAIIVGVSPAQMGVLVALETIPALLFTIPAGILADRADRRVILIATDISRAMVIGLVPLAALTGRLSFELLAFVAFFMGSLGIVFDATYESFMTEVIDIKDLTEGFQKMAVTASGAQIIGPGIGGTMLSACGAALTTAIIPAGYLASAGSLFLTRRRTNLVPVAVTAATLRQELTAGMRLVFGDRVLRDMALATALVNLGAGFVIALVVIFATRNLGLNAGEYGLLYTITSTGFFLGSTQVGRLSRRFGAGRSLTVAAALLAFSMLLVPLATPGLGVLFLVVARFLNTASNTSFNVLDVSLRQARANPAFRSRIASAFQFITWGVLPIGSLIGGWLAGPLGIVNTLFIAGILPIVGIIILRTGPVWRAQITDPGSPTA